MVKMATPKRTINHLRERVKTNHRSRDSRIPSRHGRDTEPLRFRVGQTVIGLRYSDDTLRSMSMIRHGDNASESWKTLPWKQFRRNLFRLQKRVYKAVQAGDKRKAMSLQKLILKSLAARLLAIRQVTQLNAGKKTARHFWGEGFLPKDASGIDGKKSLTIKERFELEELLKASSNDWKHHSLRSIPIPKKDGSTRMLKIPTMADRAWQCLAKYAIEPACALHYSTLGVMVLDQDDRHMMPRKSYIQT